MRRLIADVEARAQRLRLVRGQLSPDGSEALVREALAAGESDLAERVLRLAGALGNPTAMELALRGLRSGDAQLQRTATDVARAAVPDDLRPCVEQFLSGQEDLAEHAGGARAAEILRHDPDPLLREMAEEILRPPKRDGEEPTVLTSTEKLMFLRAVPIFRSVDLAELRRLADSFVTERYSKGQRIFAPDDPPRALYLIAAGRVTIDGAELGPRQAFGEVALLSGKPHSKAAEAARDTTLLVVDAEVFRALALRQPQILMELVRILSERLRDVSDSPAAEDAPEIDRGLSVIWSGSGLLELPDELREA